MSALTESEALFQAYLGEHRLPWTKLDAGGVGRQPDYCVEHQGEHCYFEVKEFDDPEPRPTQGFSPCPAVQGKVHAAARQLRAYKGRCCAVVLYNSRSIYRSVETGTVLSATFGQQFTMQPGFDRMYPEAPTYQLFGPSILRRDQNTTISGVVILRRYRLDELDFIAWRRAYARQQAQGKLGATDWFDILAETKEGRPPQYSYEGTVRVVVIENPYSRTPFPTDLMVGPFDQRWALLDDRFRLIRIGSELQRLQARGVPYLYL